MSRRRLHLVPVGPPYPPATLLHELAVELQRRLPVFVHPALPLVPPAHWWDGRHRQLRSNAVVDALIERYPAAGPHGDWVLAATAADLVADGRAFVFGEAAQGGGWAVISCARLDAARPSLLAERLTKEALHELGHLRGLDHCADPACVMAPSSDTAGVDGKAHELCDSCVDHVLGSHGS